MIDTCHSHIHNDYSQFNNKYPKLSKRTLVIRWVKKCNICRNGLGEL